MTSRFLTYSALVSLMACFGEPPSLDGNIVDPWEKPVSGAAITVGETQGTAKSLDDGSFSIKDLKPGSHKISAKKEGYIPDSWDVDFNPDADETKKANKLVLIPEPDSDGYHAVGPKGYLKLAAQTVTRSGTDLQTYQGIKSIGEAELSGEQLRLVFHTPLRMDELARLDIELHKLEFISEVEIDSVDGPTEVDVNLWTSAGKVDFQQETHGSDDNYIFRVNDLPSGSYAFVNMDLLNSEDSSRFEKIAEPLRKVHAFVVK
jgi:hypothetical protein